VRIEHLGKTGRLGVIVSKGEINYPRILVRPGNETNVYLDGKTVARVEVLEDE
jgi:hypothetical protein